MITARNFFIFVPTWNLTKQLFIENNNTWAPVKRAFVKSGGAWNQVYSENTFSTVGSQHPYWQYTLDSEFRVNDNNQNDGLATDLFNVFWSTSNTGTYAINQGSARVNLNSISTTFVPEVPGTPETPGFYNFTTESRSIFCNFTPNSAQAVTFSSPGVLPINRSGVDGTNNIKWSIRAFGFTRSGTEISSLVSDDGTVQTFNMSQTAQNFSGNGTGITTTIDRTYASSFTPGTPATPATPAYYSHYGIARMLSNYELIVSGGQTYRLSTSAISGTIDANTRWGLVAYTSTTSGQAQPFGSNAQVFQSPTYGTNSAQTFSFSIPSGHPYLRVGIFIEHNSTTSNNNPPSTPQWGRFDYLRVNRI
jgi:hypothetical protein